MSPEQCTGSSVDARSDVYSCGVILYQLVTGTPPFTGNQPGEILFQHTDIAPDPPRQRYPSIHPGLEAVVLKALAKHVDQRYQTARELRTALEEIRPELSAERSTSEKLPVLHADTAEDETITLAMDVPETSHQTPAVSEAAHASDEPGPLTQRPAVVAAVSVSARAHARYEAFGDDGDEGSRLWQPLALPSGNVESPTSPTNSAATRAARVAARRATIMSMRRSSMRPPPLRAFLLRYGLVLIALAALGTAGFAASLFLGR
jgi:serine/threonine protein kinase